MIVFFLEPPRVIDLFYYMIDLLRLFQKRSFVLSSEHENNQMSPLSVHC